MSRWYERGKGQVVQLFQGPRYSAIRPSPPSDLPYNTGTDDGLEKGGNGEDHIPTSSPLTSRTRSFFNGANVWLASYFLISLTLTLSNKQTLRLCPYPYVLTGSHALASTIGSYGYYLAGGFTRAQLSQRENLTIMAFSTLYTINIAISNISLKHVTVPFHQVVRGLTPVFTILISVILQHHRISRRTCLSILPVILGVSCATYGDYYFTILGLVLTLSGAILAALKGVVTNMILVGPLDIHPADLLLRMSPLALLQSFFYASVSGELSELRRNSSINLTLPLVINAFLAFILNFVSFTANAKTNALTMTVAANCKQVFTIVLAVLIFNLVLTPLNIIGIIITLAGGVWYSFSESFRKA